MEASAEDDRLLLQVASGDQRSFSVLFDRYSPLVLGFLVRLVRSSAEAEELLQEVFLQAWRDAPRFDARRASTKGWLLMMARSRALDRLRSRSARVRREQTAHEQSVRVEQPVGTARLEAADDQRWLGGALSELPAEQRACVELAFFEGLSQSQISLRLDVPLGTVKSRFLAGMARLRGASRAAP